MALAHDCLQQFGAGLSDEPREEEIVQHQLSWLDIISKRGLNTLLTLVDADHSSYLRLRVFVVERYLFAATEVAA